MLLQSFADLMTEEFAPLEWVVPNVFPAGLTLLAGKPKAGKSFLAVDLALSYAGGRTCLWDDYPPARGRGSLLLALEDPKRRLQTRVSLVYGDSAPAAAYYVPMGKWPNGDTTKGLKLLSEILDARTEVRLVVIDTMTHFLTPLQRGGYAEEYKSLAPLHAFANDRGISVVCLHHARKMEDDDPFATVMGTGGTTAPFDTLAVLQVPPAAGAGERRGVLHVKGRDVDESAFPLRFDECSHRWRIVETKADAAARSAAQEALLRLIPRGGSMHSTAAEAAMAAQGFSTKQTRKAREALGITSTRVNGRWVWSSPTAA